MTYVVERTRSRLIATRTTRRMEVQALCIAPLKEMPWHMILRKDFGTAHAPVLETLTSICKRLRITNAYIPTGYMSATVASRESFSRTYTLPNGTILHFDEAPTGEAVPLLPGEAFMVPTLGGCGLIAASREDHCVAAHAGRDSLIDRNRLIGHPASALRSHESIVYAIKEYLDQDWAADHGYKMDFFFGIHPSIFAHPFNDPAHGATWEKMVRTIRQTFPYDARKIVQTRKANGTTVAYLDIGKLACIQASKKSPALRLSQTHATLPIRGVFGHTRHPRIQEGKTVQRNLGIIFRAK